VFTPVVVVAAVSAAQAAGSPQLLSCADAGESVDDGILTPADTAALDALVREMNARMQQVAGERGWAYYDVNLTFEQIRAARPPYSAGAHLACAYPYGQYVSLDGVRPNAEGYQLMANDAARAVNERYGFAIPERPVPALTAAQLCP
jgi:lysophospholipase L1-like esterase